MNKFQTQIKIRYTYTNFSA